MKDWIIKFVVLVLLLSFASLPLAAEVIYYDTNNVGTPVAMWDSTGGKVWEATYYPFGTEYQTPTNIWENTRKFAGKEKDKETDLSYFGARYYDDLSGRFLTPDPVQPVDALTSKTNAEMLTTPQRLNRYAYGLNNPYRYIDPDGRDPKDHRTDETNEVTRCHVETHNDPQKELLGVSIMATAAGGLGVRAVGSAIGAYKLAQGAEKTVGRWMSPKELEQMRRTGKVQEGGGGQTRVADPANPNTYKTPPAGDKYVEFDVPADRVLPHSKGTGRIPGPNSPDARVPGRDLSNYKMPNARNIREK